MFGVIMPLWNSMFHCIFGWYFYIEITLKYEKVILFSSSRAFSLSTPVENSEATKCNKQIVLNVLEWKPLQLKLYGLRKKMKIHLQRGFQPNMLIGCNQWWEFSPFLQSKSNKKLCQFDIGNSESESERVRF